MAFIKGADTRRDGSFVVRPAAQLMRSVKRPPAQKAKGKGGSVR